ncbi:methyltransferase-like protein 27 [Lingula anatina]|uniref:Methyltransferase-like protein 27 n=1 Tax=Lingula anatina TaxID=7574 RepID=A0A1S3JZR4_LINAN|nr:methyltransferase-like protein 27 [Lingula anatina]|eukprot:XP_013415526.1 methyltransferase-like protein 27 [Lingula anatina]
MAKRVEQSHLIMDQFKKRDITNEKVEKLYGTWAKDFEKDMANLVCCSPRINASELDILLKDKKDALILDAACGTGLAGLELFRRGYHNLHGLDGSSEMLEQAKQKGIYKKTMCSIIGSHRLDISDDTYDAVIMSGAVGCGHVHGGGLAELIRIVKPGGFVVMDVLFAYLHGTEYGGKSWDEIIDSHIMAGRWVTVTRRLVEQVFNTLDGMQYCFQGSAASHIGTFGHNFRAMLKGILDSDTLFQQIIKIWKADAEKYHVH